MLIIGCDFHAPYQKIAGNAILLNGIFQSGGNAMDLSYNFSLGAGDNGNVMGITNNTDNQRSQAFTYDALNRIASAQTASTHATAPTKCWAEVYGIDTWGNLQSIAPTANPAYTGCSQESGFTQTADNYNHLSGFSYDLAGNTLNDGVNGYAWNAESDLKTAAGVNYLYDGDGRRAAKANSANPPVPYKLYWYGPGGEVLAETDGSGNTQNEYVFFGGKRVALLPAGSTAQFYVEDMLGTSRIVTTNTGVVCYDADFYSFGGERPYTNTCLQNNYKFTGKERDTESGLDNFGARYDSSSFGRFMSPDNPKFAEKTDPQSWNLYSYVSNNPLARIDLTGLNWFYLNGTWQWYQGSNVNNNGDPCKKGSAGCNHSDYTNLIVYQETSKDGKTTRGTLTLYGNNGGFVPGNIMAQDQVAFSGGREGSSSVHLGNYEINLSKRGGPETEHMNPDLSLRAFHGGIQHLGPFEQSGEGWLSAWPEWGNYRASLIPLEGQSESYYLHGKGLYFSEGLAMTHGCIATPFENVLKTLWGLNPNGVGEGEKNGRIAVYVFGK